MNLVVSVMMVILIEWLDQLLMMMRENLQNSSNYEVVGTICLYGIARETFVVNPL